VAARSSTWLLLTTVALSTLVAVELHYGVGKGSAGRSPADATGTSPATAPGPLFALADRDSFSETLSRPLFMPNRQPVGDAAAPAAAPAARAARPNANRYTLSAVIIIDDERIALVTDTATGGSSRVREGESLAGWQVKAIRDDSAVLSNGDTTEELSLRTFAPPAPVTAPAPRRSPDTGGRSREQASNALPDRPRRPKRRPRQTLTTPAPATN
jgi:hypothetical protein